MSAWRPEDCVKMVNLIVIAAAIMFATPPFLPKV